jgi:hypothetical protein
VIPEWRGRATSEVELDLNTFLEVQGGSLESDLEGSPKLVNASSLSARTGSTVRGRSGSTRHRFFAVDVVTNNYGLTIRPAGHAVQDPSGSTSQGSSCHPVQLAAASTRAPKEKGA